MRNWVLGNYVAQCVALDHGPRVGRKNASTLSTIEKVEAYWIVDPSFISGDGGCFRFVFERCETYKPVR